jgi:hypothetical protein
MIREITTMIVAKIADRCFLRNSMLCSVSLGWKEMIEALDKRKKAFSAVHLP